MTETIPVSTRMGAETTPQKINPAKRIMACSALALSFFAAGCNFGDNSTGNGGSQNPADAELIDLDSANPSAYGSADRSKRG